MTRLLVKTFPNAAITAVDLAPGMVEVAKGLTKEDRVTFFMYGHRRNGAK
ncbi:class I SAM-dependent methyltransferase [Peribacillus frigoritolerans]|nr:class I SAM-dependent methyltransferase [Peribacillus frigoritolerans]